MSNLKTKKIDYLPNSKLIEDEVTRTFGDDITKILGKNSKDTYDDLEMLNRNKLEWRGAWVTATSYNEGDVVENDGRIYACTGSHISASTDEPGTGANWASYWEAMIGGFVNRGDPAAQDKAVGDFTTDGNWYDLDLSSIVPAGVKAILLRISILDNLVNQVLFLRKNGNSNSINSMQLRTQVANQRIHNSEAVITPDTNRVIEYWASNTVWTEINLTVAGWWF